MFYVNNWIAFDVTFMFGDEWTWWWKKNVFNNNNIY